MPGKWKKEKLESLLHTEAARFIERNAELEEGMFATVTRVTLSSDSVHADVFVSLYPANKVGSFMNTLRPLSREFSKHLRHALRMHTIPVITFRLDDTELKREHIEQLLGDDQKNV